MIKRFLSLILVFTFLLAALPAGGLDVFAFFEENTDESVNISRYILTFREDADVKTLLSGYEYRPLSAENRVYLVTAEDVSPLSAHCISVERDTSRVLLDVRTENAYDFCGIPVSRVMADGGKGVIVAVLDTGVDREHECFKDTHILEGYDATADTAGVYGDEDGHGTAVTGIIAASNGILGVAPEASVYPVKVSDGGGTVYSSHLVAGIYNAADNGADIINISLGGYSYSVSEQQAVNYAISKGCIIIAAAGNDGANAALAGKYFYPASYDGVISVASVDPDGSPSLFSQYNDKIDIAAPGRDIAVGVAGSKDQYGTESGTSFSAALVSGISALACAASDGLDGTQLSYLIISALGSDHSVYTGYGIADAEKIVSAAADPIVTGVYDGAVLSSPPVITFNKGIARLDGKPFLSGGTVTEGGTHVLSVTYKDNTKTISFTVSDEKLEYSVNADSITFSFGFGYLDGMPYISGSQISDGVHKFLLRGEYTSVSATVNIGAEGYLTGVENGAVYSHAVSLRGYGNGIFSVNGVPFTGIKVLSDGDYTATVTDQNGAVTYSASFTVKTARKEHSGIAGSLIHADKENGYLLATDSNTGIRVYNSENLSAPLRTLRLSERIVAFEQDGEALYIITENAVYSVPRASLNGADAPTLTPIEGYVPFGGYSIRQNRLYFEDNLILSTPYGDIISVEGDRVFTSYGIVSLTDGSLLSVFCDELVSISLSYAVFRNIGLVEFTDISDISAPADKSAFGSVNTYNKYTLSAYTGLNPQQTAFDSYSGKIYILSEGTVYFTDNAFITSGEIPLRFVPLYITASFGKLYVFFENGYCKIDSYTLEQNYFYGLSCPERAVCGDGFIVASYGNRLAIIVDGTVTYEEEMPVSDIAISLDNIFVANSQGIGVFAADGSFTGVIPAGDTKALYTDGVYVASRDTVYLASDGSVVTRIPANITAITKGLVFTDKGVYSPYGKLLSDLVYEGLFADGYCITAEKGHLTVHGGEDTAVLPTVVGGEGVNDIYAEISTDIGVLFVDGKLFEGGRYLLGGDHRLECVTPFGIITSSQFSVIPALSGISVSGGDKEMNPGETQYILVEYLPYGASAVDAEFSVTGDSVTVDRNGLITAVSEGVSVITVTAGGFTASVTVTVTRLEISFTHPDFIFDADTRTFRIPAGTTAERFGEVIAAEGKYYRIVSEDGTDITPEKLIKTGCVFNFLSDTGSVIATVTAVVMGDTDKDGMLSALDTRILEKGINGEDIGVYPAYAGDVDGDGELTEADSEKLLSMIDLFTRSASLEKSEYKVTASVPATVHPAGEFAVIMYVDRGVGIDSVIGNLAYDTEIFELLYVAGVNYSLSYQDNDGVITFAAYDENGTPSDRVIKTFGTAMFRVKENAPLKNAEFLLTGCAVTAVGNIYSSEESVKATSVSKRSANEFTIKISNAEFFVFNPSIRNYYVELPYNAVAVDIELDYPEGGVAYCSDTLIPESDELTVTVRYTSPQGVSTNYKIHVTRAGAETLNSDPLLESITSSVGTLTPVFTAERLTYKLSIPFDSPDPTFTCIPRNENTVVTVRMPESFPVGSTVVEFHCVAQDGTEAKYVITVVREKNSEESDTSDNSVADDNTGGGKWIIAVTVSVTAVALAAIIYYLINRKGKNNVKEIK